MTRRRLAFVLARVALVGVPGCAAALAHPGAEDARWAASRWPGIELRDLEGGRTLYADRCAGCHNLHQPAELAPEKWQTAVSEMAGRARLGAKEQDLVVRYLAAASARARSCP